MINHPAIGIFITLPCVGVHVVEMTRNNVPPAVRKAVASAVRTDRLVSIEGASEFEGALVEIKSCVGQSLRDEIRRSGGRVGTIMPGDSHGTLIMAVRPAE